MLFLMFTNHFKLRWNYQIKLLQVWAATEMDASVVVQ